MNNIEIRSTIDKGDWEAFLRNFLPVNIVDLFSFSEAMKIVDELLQASSEVCTPGSVLPDQLRDFCINVMIILRERCATEWLEDWKNDAYLGILCGITFREEEAFKYIARAMSHVNDPPQSLILAYISAGDRAEGLLSCEEIASLSKLALEKGETYEATLQMGYIAYREGNERDYQLWNKKAEKAKTEGRFTDEIVPDVLKQ